MADSGYSTNLDLLYEVFFNGLLVSRKLSGLSSSNPRERIAAILFAKSVACAASILKLLPRSRLATTENEFWDISSVASLTRNLMETSNNLFHLSVESVPQSAIEVRLKIQEYHMEKEHQSMLTKVDLVQGKKGWRSSDLHQLKAELNAMPDFQKLNAKIRKKILDGKISQLLSHPKIAEIRGFNRPAFEATYKYLSNHVHSTSFSVIDMVLNNAVGIETDETRNWLSAMAHDSACYLASEILNVFELFPAIKDNIEPEKLILVHDLVEKLKSPPSP